mgnify:CR=1 FL=1
MEAEVSRYIEKSNKRIDSICPYYDRCGGCDLLHTSYDNQVASKRRSQRKLQLSAPSSIKRRLMSCHLSKSLREQLVNYSEKTGKDLTSVIENDLSTNVTNFGSAFKNAKNKGNTAFAKISEASTKNKNKISGNLDKTKTKASTTFGNIKKDSNTKLNGIKDRNVKIKGNNDDAKKKIDDTKKKLTFKDKTVNLFVNIVATIKEKIGKIAEVFKNVIKAFGYSVGDWLGFTTKSGKKKTKKIEKTHRAIGGFPKLGSMFIAGEKGAELVGEINHKSGVASQGEITGIRDSMETSSAV